MAEDIHTGDPTTYSWLSSTSLQHNISITFTDARGKRLFDIDSRPSSDPKQYRHKIALRFSKLDSTIRVRETFATVHAGREFHGKVAEKEDQMSVTATLMLPGTSYVVERGVQEQRPWPERPRFVIKLALLETGIEREMLSFKHVGDNSTRLESECGELALRRHLKWLGGGVKGLTVFVDNFRGNRSFEEDEVRGALLPRFAVVGAPSFGLVRVPLPVVVGIASGGNNVAVVERRIRGQVDGSGIRIVERTEQDQVDGLMTSRKRKAEDKIDRENAGGEGAEDVEEEQTNRPNRRRRRKLKSHRGK